MSTHTYPDGTVASYPDVLDLGEVPPAATVVALHGEHPAPIDHVTGVATLASLHVRTADQWCVCVCADDLHHDLLVDDVWDDGQHTERECWRDTRAEAERDLTVVHTLVVDRAHIVIRPARVVTAPIEADL